VEVFYFGRGPEHQKLQVTTLAGSSQFSVTTKASSNRHTVTKQFDGALVTYALSNAACLFFSSRVPALVL